MLSEYGEFFPTHAGLNILTTKPDLTQTNDLQGECPVYVIKLQLDVNHDGEMDLSWFGPDNTSQANPMRFWANNDFDRKHQVDCNLLGTVCDTAEDDLKAAGAPGNPNGIVPDYTYGTFVPFQGIVPSIPCEKDLEDYARLWLPGLSNLMAVMPANYTVKLTLTGSGQIRIFRALEPSGGTNYLFDLTTASNQVVQSASLYVGLLTSSSPIVLTNRSEHFIFCGVQRGSAEVHLQILDGNTNTIADTAAYLELKDIKEMYERWTIGDNPNKAPTNTAYLAAEDLPAGATRFRYPSPDSTNTPYILYVHGWNMERWEKDRFGETAFKRLFWQGYQGRFGIFRWPTHYAFPAAEFSLQAVDPRNYDSSEYTAWRSATGLLNFLTGLKSTYGNNVYLLAHSMGNVVAGEALRLAGTNQVVNTYVASQAAVPAHTYDNSIPDYSFTYTINWGPFTPNIYNDWLLSNSGGTGRRINFYNTNDYALDRPRWELNQLMKPDTGFTDWTYGFDGYPYDGTNSYTAGPPDDTPPWNHFFKENFWGTQTYFDIVNVLTNRYEVMAYAAQSRSTAFGRTPGVHNITGNVDLGRTSPRIWPPDLENPTAPYSAHKWHSAQFRSTNMEQHNYWQTLLFSVEGFNLPNP